MKFISRMPIQSPQWTEFLSCPVCCNDFDSTLRGPISLGCGHTICHTCLGNLHRKQCPFDQNPIKTEIRCLPMNDALLNLIGDNNAQSNKRNNGYEKLIPLENHRDYLIAKKCIEELALFLKPFQGTQTNGTGGSLVSRPMQRKLVTLLGCQLIEEEGRARAVRVSRSLGERSVTELIVQHQNPQQLSGNLWAAVRARGCQFLGPAMQEEVLKLVLLALEDGSALSRKVLVMFVVQRLESHFPQASKTSIGHVVQLLYRASCFKVSKREGDSSLMQLKDEFRTYEALRREHDAQIVQIATEAGLRIAPDQWSGLLYGDTAHKSHMQSIIDKLQTPQSFAQSVHELIIVLQRTPDPTQLSNLRPQLELLASIDPNSESNYPNWSETVAALEAIEKVVKALIEYIKQHGNNRKSSQDDENGAVSLAGLSVDNSGNLSAGIISQSKYKVSMCRDVVVRGSCPRSINCTFAHSNLELDKYRSRNRKISCMRRMADESILKNDSIPYQGCKELIYYQHYHNNFRQMNNNNFINSHNNDDFKTTIACNNFSSIDDSSLHMNNGNFTFTNCLNNGRAWNLTQQCCLPSFPVAYVNNKTKSRNINDNNNNNDKRNNKKHKRTIATRTLSTLLQRRMEIMNELENIVGKESVGSQNLNIRGKNRLVLGKPSSSDEFTNKYTECMRFDGNVRENTYDEASILNKPCYWGESDRTIGINCGIERIVSASSLQLESEKVKQQLRVLEERINDLKIATKSAALISDFQFEKNNVQDGGSNVDNCWIPYDIRPCMSIVNDLITNHPDSMNEKVDLKNYCDEDGASYEADIANDMRELEQHWDFELSEEEKCWSNEGSNPRKLKHHE